MFMKLLALLALTTLGTTARSDNPVVNGVTVFELGQYHAVSAGLSPLLGTMGPLHAVHSVQLIAATTAVPARRYVRFGLRYIVEGHPRGRTIDLQMVTRFPDGGLKEPDAEHRHYKHEYRMPVQLGIPAYRDYTLDEAWEVVPGRWVFEFWLGNRKLKEQEFCLFDPTASVPTACRQAISVLPEKHLQSHTPTETHLRGPAG